MKSTLLSLETLILALLSALVLTGCASHRPLQVAEHVTRGTIYKVQHDSIPYEVRVVETKVERHIPWYAKLLSWIGALALILLLARLTLLFLRGR